MNEEKVVTFANEFGRWHARVEFPYPGYGPEYRDAHIDRIRAKARRAIKRKIAARENLDPNWRCRVEVVDSHLDHMNRMLSITYAEV